ncbi:hypothetical protein M8J76_004604 [Diaphorina citri]|nr:hypothetical protein M8J76_004604 [Diaphorina citri]
MPCYTKVVWQRTPRCVLDYIVAYSGAEAVPVTKMSVTLEKAKKGRGSMPTHGQDLDLPSDLDWRSGNVE